MIGTPPGKDKIKSNGTDDVHVILAFNIGIYDHGDAPASYDNGDDAAEAISALLYLGKSADAEYGSIAGAAATGDDLRNSGAPDDEDGVTVIPNLTIGDATYSITASVFNNTTKDATLQGWIDINHDGVFSASEFVSKTVTSTGASQNITLTWTIPATEPTGVVHGADYLRLRLTNNAALTDTIGTTIDERSIGTVGKASGGSSGEVEDYTFTNFAPDITATNTNNVSGATTLGNSWTWTIHVANDGNLAAAFASGEQIFFDNLPNANITYGSVTISNQVGITGTIVGSIASNNLTVSASGAVSMAGSSGFDVTFTATPTAIGTFANPRSGGSESADPTNTILEDLEGNNKASDTVVVTAPELSATMTNNVAGAASMGGNWTWTIHMVNNGNAPATFTTGQQLILDNLPNTNINYGSVSFANQTGITGTLAGSITSSNLSVTASGGSVTIAPGGSFDVLFTATPTAIGTFTSPRGGGTASVDANTLISESNEANNTFTDTVVVTAKPDLALTNSDGVVTANPGDTLTYTLTITNSGFVTATGVVLTDVIPANTTFVSATGGGVEGPTGTVTWAIGSVALSGGTASVTVTVHVNNTVAAGATTLVNAASVTDDGANGTDPTPANNAANDTDTLTAAPDLVVIKSDATGTATPGGTLTYTITVTNNGNQNATGVNIDDTLPANTTFSSASGVYVNAAGHVTWAIGALAGGGGFVTRTVTVTVNSVVPAGVSTIVNSATATDDGTNGPDPTPANNTGTDTDTLDAAPDLVLIKTDATGTATPGGTLTYTLTLTNNGNQNATGVNIDDTLPANTTFSSASGVYVNAAGHVTWAIGALAGGGGFVTRTVTVTVNSVVPAGVSTIVNSATGTDDGTNGPDPTPANNTGTDTDTLNAAPDLVVTITDGVTTANFPDVLTYTITVTNNGNQNATGVSVVDVLPPELTFNSLTGPGVNSLGTVTWTVGALAGGGGTTSFTVTATINSGANMNLVNPATAADDGANGADPTPANNSASDTDAINSAPTPLPTPSQTITQTSEAVTTANRVVVGEIIRYRALIEIPRSSYGNFTVHEYLPPGLQYLGNAALAFWTTVSGNLTSSTYSAGGLNFTETTPLASVVPTVGITGTEATPGGGFTNGEDVIFNLGDIANIENDVNAEYMILEFNALVLNDSPTSYITTFDIGANLTPTVVGNALTASLVEPRLDIHNTVIVNGSGTYGDTGDPLYYTYTIVPNATTSGSTAFDLNVTSPIPATVTGLVLTSASIFNSVTHATTNVLASFNLAGSSLVTIGNVDLLTTDTLTIRIDGVLGTVTPGVNLVDVATVTWSSLDGATGTAVNPTGQATPGASGAADGERNGNASGENDYISQDTSTVVTPAIDLVAQQITYTPGPYSPGQMVYANVRYSNLGTTAAGPHTVSLYTSADGTTPGRLLGTFTANLLNPGSRTVPISWPATAADSDTDPVHDGTSSNYFLAVVDSGLVVDETNENNNVVATASPTAYTVTVPTVTILPNGPTGSDLAAEEGTSKSGKFVFKRTGDISSPLTITVSLAGTTVPADFTGTVFPTQVITFGANQATAVFYVSPVSDTVDIAPETLVATILDDPTSPKAYTVIGPSQTMNVTGPIPVVNLIVTDALATEKNATTGTYRLTRAAGKAASQPVTVTVDFTGTATPGADYVITLNGAIIPFSGTTINFTIPANRTFVEFKVRPIDDNLAPPTDPSTETVIATILTDSAPVPTYTIGTNVKTVNIEDNDGLNIKVILTGNNQTLYAPTNSGPNKIPIVVLNVTNTETKDSLATTFQVRLIAAVPGRAIGISDFEDSTYQFPVTALPRVRAGKTATIRYHIRLSFLDALPPGIYYAAVKVDAGNAMLNEKSETDNYAFTYTQFTVVDPNGGSNQ